MTTGTGINLREKGAIMPAYFSTETQFDRNKVTDTFIKDFYTCFSNLGAHFLAGARDSKDFSYEQQIERDQQLISGCKIPWGYYQAYFSFGGFSEVRGYWGLHSGNPEFSLIIPEDDFFEYGDKKIERYYDRMKLVKDLFVGVWKFPAVLMVQTAWECSDVPGPYYKISKSNPPQTEPFSIVSVRKYKDCWPMKMQRIERNGVLLEMKDNWFMI